MRGSHLRAAGIVLALAALGVASVAQLASAHPDRPAASGEYRIPATSSIDLPIELHFHRLVGDFAVIDGRGRVSILALLRAPR